VTSAVTTVALLLSSSNYPPKLQALTTSGSNFTFSWNTVSTYPAVGYQVQSTTNLATTNWINVGGILAGTNAILISTNEIGSDRERFYRVLLAQ
jgi:hypothetical protein